MRRECRLRFPRHRLQRKPLVCDPGMHHGNCVEHVPWCMLDSLTRGGGEDVPGIPGACATSNFAYLARGSWDPHQFSIDCVDWLLSWFRFSSPLNNLQADKSLLCFYSFIKPILCHCRWSSSVKMIICMASKPIVSMLFHLYNYSLNLCRVTYIMSLRFLSSLYNHLFYLHEIDNFSNG